MSACLTPEQNRRILNRAATRRRKDVRRGFTLIEILIVITIIAILAAILLPVFSRVREKARQITCASNLSQLGKAFLLYTQDYDERFPGPAPFTAVPNPADWIMNTQQNVEGQFSVERGSLYAYVKNKPVYVCPSHAFSRIAQNVDRFSYTMNELLGLFFEGGVHFPSSTFLLIEDHEQGINDGFFWLNEAYTVNGYTAPNSPQTGRCDRPTMRHNEGLNMLFVDGHVKWLPQRRVNPCFLHTVLGEQAVGDWHPGYVPARGTE